MRKACVFLTIYSVHHARGKVQILATYEGSSGVVSTTVTSVETLDLATPIVDALNLAATCVARPLGLHEFDARVSSYPSDHIDALINDSARAALLHGATNLWYEHVKFLLHSALQDLDRAVQRVPAPVSTAIRAELEKEHEQLSAEFADYQTGVPNPDRQRFWDSDHPFIRHDGGRPALSDFMREQLNREDRGWTDAQVRHATDDLRLLHEVVTTSTAPADVELTLLSIFFEPDLEESPDGPGRYFLEIKAPEKGLPGRFWRIEVGEWITTEEGPDGSSATGETILVCDLSERPSVSDLAALLNAADTAGSRVAEWAATSIGEPLAGTPFIVSTRHK
jgi:hypothetical protein